MKIYDFNYFNTEDIADSKKSASTVSNQDFDLDLQVSQSIQAGGKPIVNGSGHFWCHLTDSCTGVVCSLLACGE